MKRFDIHKELKQAGLIVSLDWDNYRVRIENPELLTPELREQIIRFHTAILCRLKKITPKPETNPGELIERRKKKRIQVTLSEERYKQLFPHGI
jgi:hypothetical protein